MGRSLVAFVAALAVAAHAAADADAGDPAGACVDAAIRAIQTRYEAIRDLRAEFVQTTRSVALGAASGRVTTSRGTAVFAKPGRMSWSYREPEPSRVVSDGETLWIYDPTRAEAQRLAVGEEFLSGAAIQFLLGRGDMRRDFRVRAEACGEQFVELELVPRRDATYEKLRVRADRASGDVVRTSVVDLLGNVTEVEFSELRANLDPPPETFRFDPPPGVRVIEIGAPGAGGDAP